MNKETIQEINHAIDVIRTFCKKTKCERCPFLHKSYPDYCEFEDYPVHWDKIKEETS